MNKINNAVNNFIKGYACSQAILTEYCGQSNVNRETALKLASGFAAGMRMGRTCGAVTGAYMVLGLLKCQGNCSTIEGRQTVYQAVMEFTNQFKEVHGSINCSDLLGVDMSKPDGMQLAKEKKLFLTLCPKYVETAAKLLEQLIKNT